jgi:hypothetical protein
MRLLSRAAAWVEDSLAAIPILGVWFRAYCINYIELARITGCRSGAWMAGFRHAVVTELLRGVGAAGRISKIPSGIRFVQSAVRCSVSTSA